MLHRICSYLPRHSIFRTFYCGLFLPLEYQGAERAKGKGEERLVSEEPEENRGEEQERHKLMHSGGFMKSKRVFGYFEVVFDIAYLCVVGIIGIWILSHAGSAPQILAGIMALILVCGDAFHLLPRIIVVLKGGEERLQRALGFGKFITSISMTVFYLFLWSIGRMLCFPGIGITWTIAVYILAALRIILCFFPQNRWNDRKQPLNWGIYRNTPFFLLGTVEIMVFWIYRTSLLELQWIWLAVLLSFLFYLPVVLWVNKSSKLGMLMFPKTCAYIWIVLTFLAI